MATQTATKEKTSEKPAVAENKGQVVALHAPRLPYHPALIERGFDEGQWRTLVEAVFPAAKSVEAVLLAIDYCKARKLDIFKRAVHIVPIWDNKARREVETVWPGIAEHRITACRTGQYAGSEPAQFGPTIEHTFEWVNEDDRGNTSRGNFTMKFPEWCQLTVYKIVHGQRVAFPGPRVYWLETYARKGRSVMPNDRWKSAPFQMIEKCSEAAALRRAFPEEIGDEWTAEEAGAIQVEADRTIDVAPQIERPKRDEPPKPSPFEVVDALGEVHEFGEPQKALAAFAEIIAACKTSTDAVGFWESNNLPAQLRDRGHVELADQCHKLFTDTAKALEPKADATTSTAAEKPAPVPSKFVPHTVKVPPAPDGEASDWKAWGVAIIKELANTESEEDLSKLIDANQKAFETAADLGPKAYKSVNAALDKRRKQIKDGLPWDEPNPLLGA